MNEQNLIKNEDLTPSQRRESASRAGKASGEARRRRADMRKAAMAVLDAMYDIRDKNTGELKQLSGADAIVLKQFEKAMHGNAKAFELLRDTSGQKPVEKVEQVNIDMEYEQSVEYVKQLMERND